MQSRAATSAIRGIRKAQIVREETQLAIAKPLYKPRDRIGQGGRFMILFTTSLHFFWY
jgi:hypothetical protein